MKRESIKDVLAREAELFERQKDLPGTRRVGRPRLPDSERGQVYSLRIPLPLLEELRRVAARAGEQPAVMMRRWILERLGETSGRAATVGEPAAIYASAESKATRAGKRPRKNKAGKATRPRSSRS